jgi:hypothetical protein
VIGGTITRLRINAFLQVSMKHIHFFATREDLLPVLAAFERTASVKYVPLDGGTLHLN